MRRRIRRRVLGVTHLELRHTAQMADWPVRTDKITMERRLPGSADELSKQLGSKLRSQIKRPVREGAVGVNGGAELLDEFYAVFARNMRDLGTPVYRAPFLRGDPCALSASRDGCSSCGSRGRPSPRDSSLGGGERLEIPWASSLREANAVGVNMLLYWNVLEYACSARLQGVRLRPLDDRQRYVSLQAAVGRGAAPAVLALLAARRRRAADDESPNPKYRLAVAAWQRLPLAVANRLGPLLVRNLP